MVSFFFNDTATTEIYTLSLHDALPISGLAISESDLIAVELPPGQQPLLQICSALLQGEINIHYAYPLITHPHGRPARGLGAPDTDIPAIDYARYVKAVVYAFGQHGGGRRHGGEPYIEHPLRVAEHLRRFAGCE